MRDPADITTGELADLVKFTSFLDLAVEEHMGHRAALELLASRRDFNVGVSDAINVADAAAAVLLHGEEAIDKVLPHDCTRPDLRHLGLLLGRLLTAIAEAVRADDWDRANALNEAWAQ